MREIQILNQNLNMIAFDPMFGQELSKSGKVPHLADFRQFLAKKGGRLWFELNFEAIIGILASFSTSYTSFVFIFTF